MQTNKILSITIPILLILGTIIALPMPQTAAQPPEGATLLRCDEFVHGPRGVTSIIYRVIPGETWRAMFWKKEAAYLAPTAEELEQARKDANILIVRGMPDIGSLGALWMNAKKSPTKFLGFRKAVGHLIDWDWVLNTVWGGNVIMWPTIYPAGGATEWLNETCTFPEYSKDLALKALQDAGFKKEGGEWIDPEGNKVEPIIIVAPSYSPQRMEVAKALGKALEELGFKTVYEFHGWSECEKLTYLDKNYHIFFNYPSFDAINMPTAYKNLFHSTSYTPPGTLCQNYMGVQDQVLDNLIDDFAATTTWEEAKQLCKAIQGRIWEQAYAYMIPTGGGGYSLRRLDMYKGWYVKRDIYGGTIEVLHLTPTEAKYATLLYAEDPNIGGKDWFVSFNPLIWTEALYEWNYFKFVYQPLFYIQYGPDVKTQFVAALAYAYKIEDYNGGSKITFYLYPNATWHDGTPFTAEDVKFTFDFMCKQQEHANRLYLPLKDIYDKSEVIDSHTVAVYTKTKSIWQMFAFTTAWILPKHIWSELKDPAAYENYPPIGTGPFKVAQWVPREYLLLEAWGKYHLKWLTPEERAAREVTALTEKIKQLTQTTADLQDQINSLKTQIQDLNSKLVNANFIASVASAIAVIAVIAAIAAIVLARRKTLE